MDGVITSEDGYWRAAACALLEFAAHLGHLHSQQEVADETLPWRIRPDLRAIAEAKAFLINTNWDLCHLAALALCWRLCHDHRENTSRLLAIDWDGDGPSLPLLWPAGLQPDLNSLIDGILPHASGQTGFTLLEALAAKTGAAAPLLARKGPVWQWLYRRFQQWFNGQPGRKGIIENENLLLPPSRIAGALDVLRAGGWSLGIATGRTRDELLPTLRRFGLLSRFAEESIVTHDEVALAETVLAADGKTAHLSKPHPFPFLRALFPGQPAVRLLAGVHPPLAQVVIVGDTAADMAAAKALGVMAVGVLTGPGGASGGEALRAAGAQHLLPDVTHLPRLLG